MDPSCEIFDHTADMGIRVRAGSQPGLIEPATRGLYLAIGELVPSGESESVSLRFAASDAATLLRDYMAELLLFFERDDRIATGVLVQRFTDQDLTVTVDLCRIDRSRSIADHEVKAITYHELAIRTIPGGFEASVIVDI